MRSAWQSIFLAVLTDALDVTVLGCGVAREKK